jgi:peptidylprolyl isomerase
MLSEEESVDQTICENRTTGRLRWASLVMAMLALLAVGTHAMLNGGYQGFIEKQEEEPKVTKEVFFDVTIGDAEPERITIGLFGDVVPKTVDNFISLCKGDKKGKSGRVLHFKDSKFQRITPEFVIQGGDINLGDRTGGESIYGSKFDDENFKLKHTGPGILTMANYGRNTNDSRFYITTTKTSWLDGVHVVFGKVIKGMDVVMKVNAVGGPDGIPRKTVKIHDSGVLRE